MNQIEELRAYLRDNWLNFLMAAFIVGACVGFLAGGWVQAEYHQRDCLLLYRYIMINMTCPMKGGLEDAYYEIPYDLRP